MLVDLIITATSSVLSFLVTLALFIRYFVECYHFPDLELCATCQHVQCAKKEAELLQFCAYQMNRAVNTLHLSFSSKRRIISRYPCAATFCLFHGIRSRSLAYKSFLFLFLCDDFFLQTFSHIAPFLTSFKKSVRSK